jgi:hypothetical protein
MALSRDRLRLFRHLSQFIAVIDICSTVAMDTRTK